MSKPPRGHTANGSPQIYQCSGEIFIYFVFLCVCGIVPLPFFPYEVRGKKGLSSLFAEENINKNTTPRWVTPQAPELCQTDRFPSLSHWQRSACFLAQYPPIMTRTAGNRAVFRKSHYSGQAYGSGSGLPSTLDRLILAASVPSSTRLCLNHGWRRACFALIRLLGSYTKIFCSRSRNCLLKSFVDGMMSFHGYQRTRRSRLTAGGNIP